MIELRFETHATSTDNELGVASGHADPALSALGREQAAEMGARHGERRVDAVYHSNLRRAVQTAEIAFAGSGVRLVADRRLRECDYGELTASQADSIASMRRVYVDRAYPSGESYRDVVRRVEAFLHDLNGSGDSTVIVIGHRATYYSLEHLCNGVPLEEAVGREWRWQPGWLFGLV